MRIILISLYNFCFAEVVAKRFVEQQARTRLLDHLLQRREEDHCGISRAPIVNLGANFARREGLR
jgi:hypothetical protein